MAMIRSNAEHSISAPLLPDSAEWLGEAALPFELAVAWSGGADSTALLLALISLGHRVHAWHIDHGWRAESSAEAEILRQRAEKWGVSFLSARDPAACTSNREASARDFRYKQFETWGKLYGVSTVCLAHHREDQAETICLRMLQGSGIHGIRGMVELRKVGSLQLMRPLLHVSRKALRRALQRAEVPWVEDPSNDDLGLKRNQIRHRVFPAMTEAGVDPQQLYQRWGDQAENLAALIDVEVEKVPVMRAEDSVSVTWREWERIMPHERARLLQKMTQMLFGEGVVPGRRHICLVEAWTIKNGSGGLDLSRCRLLRHHGRLHLVAVGASLCR